MILLGILAFRYAGELLLVSAPAEPPEVIVVLASHEWERLPLAAELAQRYPAARVLLTVPAEITEHNCFECATRVGRLADAGISRERVTVLPNGVTNTYDEAKAARAFVRKHPVGRLMIVTSPYHGRRALATFRHLFGAAGLRTEVGLASPVSGIDPSRWWLRQYDREYVAYEWAGLVYYAIRFRVPPAVSSLPVQRTRPT
jgi:uncharacterized SAM-binding protein YcdF (DUF218 family)